MPFHRNLVSNDQGAPRLARRPQGNPGRGILYHAACHPDPCGGIPRQARDCSLRLKRHPRKDPKAARGPSSCFGVAAGRPIRATCCRRLLPSGVRHPTSWGKTRSGRDCLPGRGLRHSLQVQRSRSSGGGIRIQESFIIPKQYGWVCKRCTEPKPNEEHRPVGGPSPVPFYALIECFLTPRIIQDPCRKIGGEHTGM